jgi:hypothetical protein
MPQKWYQKASVQAAIVGGIFLIIAAIISGVFTIAPVYFGSQKEKLEQDLNTITIDTLQTHSKIEPQDNTGSDSRMPASISTPTDAPENSMTEHRQQKIKAPILTAINFGEKQDTSRIENAPFVKNDSQIAERDGSSVLLVGLRIKIIYHETDPSHAVISKILTDAGAFVDKERWLAEQMPPTSVVKYDDHHIDHAKDVRNLLQSVLGRIVLKKLSFGGSHDIEIYLGNLPLTQREER